MDEAHVAVASIMAQLALSGRAYQRRSGPLTAVRRKQAVCTRNDANDPKRSFDSVGENRWHPVTGRDQHQTRRHSSKRKPDPDRVPIAEKRDAPEYA